MFHRLALSTNCCKQLIAVELNWYLSNWTLNVPARLICRCSHYLIIFRSSIGKITLVTSENHLQLLPSDVYVAKWLAHSYIAEFCIRKSTTRSRTGLYSDIGDDFVVPKTTCKNGDCSFAVSDDIPIYSALPYSTHDWSRAQALFAISSVRERWIYHSAGIWNKVAFHTFLTWSLKLRWPSSISVTAKTLIYKSSLHLPSCCGALMMVYPVTVISKLIALAASNGIQFCDCNNVKLLVLNREVDFGRFVNAESVVIGCLYSKHCLVGLGLLSTLINSKHSSRDRLAVGWSVHGHPQPPMYT